MKRAAISLILAVLFGATSGVVAQTTIEEARKQGNDLGKAMRADSSLGPSEAKLAELPGYGGTDLPEKVYFDDPDRLAAAWRKNPAARQNGLARAAGGLPVERAPPSRRGLR